MKKVFVSTLLAVALLAATSVFAAPPPHGMVWLNGQQVRVLVPPAHVPAGSGTDPIYVVPDQLSVAGVGPGDAGYHGGRWQVWVVTWNQGVTPYLLNSRDAVMAAQSAGDITITRNPDGDNRCPINPGHGGMQR